MYVPIIAASDLTTLIYQEILDEITRADSAKVDTAINTSIDEVKMYLSRYDLIQMFGDKDNELSATFTNNDYLKKLCVDIACWNLIRLANPNVNYESIKDGYEKAISALTKIQKGLADPKWPYQDTTGEDAPPSDQVTMKANPKRENYY